MADNARKRKSDSNEAEEVKRVRCDSDGAGENTKKCESENVLTGFKIQKILNDSPREKTSFIHGELANQPCVVILEKTPFTEDTLPDLFEGCRLKLQISNNIYSTYSLQAPPHLSEIKTTVVYPATEKHIKKYQRQESFLVEETGKDYREITLPFIEENKFSLDWVYNILEKKAEADKIVYEDEDPEKGFVLLPDFKWNQKQVEDLYLIAIIRRRDVRSLRELTSEHIPLLQNIFDKGKEAILNRYELPASKLRVYLHYQPSYYHLHIHFTRLDYDVRGCSVERAHLLSDVIQNLQADSQYYQKRTMYFPLRADDELLSKFREAGKL